MKNRLFKRGDIVKVWALQSFFGGGFLNGETAIVRQDQTSEGSVLLMVTRKNVEINGFDYLLDTSYEVYDQQVKLIKKTTEKNTQRIQQFLKQNAELRMTEHSLLMAKKEDYKMPYHYAPEAYITYVTCDDKIEKVRVKWNININKKIKKLNKKIEKLKEEQ